MGFHYFCKVCTRRTGSRLAGVLPSTVEAVVVDDDAVVVVGVVPPLDAASGAALSAFGLLLFFMRSRRDRRDSSWKPSFICSTTNRTIFVHAVWLT